MTSNKIFFEFKRKKRIYDIMKKEVRRMFRIGQSSDIHPFVEGRKLILGGVEVPHTKGLGGHSDADVLTHAIAESILGALALGDLGKYFPDTDKQYKNRCSLDFLAQIYNMMEEKGYQIQNLDSLILTEKPKLAAYIPQMKENIMKVLHCESDQVNIKATRGEKIGFIGREEGAMAQCVVLLRKKG